MAIRCWKTGYTDLTLQSLGRYRSFDSVENKTMVAVLSYSIPISKLDTSALSDSKPIAQHVSSGGLAESASGQENF